MTFARYFNICWDQNNTYRDFECCFVVWTKKIGKQTTLFLRWYRVGIQWFFPLLIYCSRILYLESGPFHSKVRFECWVVVPWYVIPIKPLNTMIE